MRKCKRKSFFHDTVTNQHYLYMSQNHIMTFKQYFSLFSYQLSTIVAVMKRQHVSVRDNFQVTNFRQSCARPVYHVENSQIQCCQHWWGQSLTRIVLTGSFLCDQTFSKAEAKSWWSYWFILLPLLFVCRIPQFWKITTGSRQWACSERLGCSPTCQLRTGRPDTDTTLTSFIWSHHSGPVCFFFFKSNKDFFSHPAAGTWRGIWAPWSWPRTSADRTTTCRGSAPTWTGTTCA